MELTYIAGGIAFLVLVVWLIRTLNAYSEEKYYYRPIGIGTIFLTVIPYVLLIAGYLLKDSDPNNLSMAIILASASVIGLFLWISHHSSAMVAAGAIVLLMISGILAMLIFTFSGRDDYYYD